MSGCSIEEGASGWDPKDALEKIVVREFRLLMVIQSLRLWDESVIDAVPMAERVTV